MKRTHCSWWLLVIITATFLVTAMAIAAHSAVTLNTDFTVRANAQVYAIASTAHSHNPDAILGGAFTTVTHRNFQEFSIKHIAGVTQDGYVWGAFNPGNSINNNIITIAQQPDGKVLIGGWFTYINATPRNRIARLHSDGTLDTSFSPTSGANNDVHGLILQDNGKILICGSFSTVNGASRNGIARLHANGRLDRKFDPGTGANGGIWTMVQQDDGKIVIGGDFTTINGTTRIRVARLTANGSLDTSFDPGDGANNDVEVLTRQQDGKILVGGRFTSVGGNARRYIARLNADGSFDYSFGSRFANRGPDSHVYTIAQQADGKILIGGEFTEVDGITNNYIARLSSEGVLDTSFNPGSGPNNIVYAITLTGKGAAYVGGAFTTFNGFDHERIANISLGEGAADSLDVSPDGHSLAWTQGGTGPVFQRAEFFISENPLSDWTYLGSGQRIASGWELGGLNLPLGQWRYIRSLGYYDSGYKNGSGSIKELISEMYLRIPPQPEPSKNNICFPIKTAIGEIAIICL
ncbi:MAG: delta-60 repeat domain-containing protein [Desulfobulbaceae bacterium]|nr:delta-60 repeat domain-containing protein [Desulfobulbaceae bacterium]